MKQRYLCQWNDIAEGDSRGFQLAGQGSSQPLSVLAVKKAGQLFLYHNLCPHAYIPLEWVEHEFLTTDKSLIQCANHGALFTIDGGHCVAGPCAGQKLRALTYIRDNDEIYLAPEVLE